jgi:hypothetical protein
MLILKQTGPKCFWCNFWGLVCFLLYRDVCRNKKLRFENAENCIFK